MAAPNFIIIGAHKAGTTSIYRYLGQHPEIYMSPIKETNYFAFDNSRVEDDDYYAVKDWDQYLALFKYVKKEIAIGEVSPEYMLSQDAARRIKKRLPHCRLIACLREPVSRAYSHYAHEVRNHQRDSLLPPRVDDINLSQRWIRAGFYNRSLKRFYEIFPREQIKIVMYDDLEENALKVMQELFQFLGANASFKPDVSVNYNAGGVPKNKVLYSLLQRTRLGPTARYGIPRYFRSSLSGLKGALRGLLLEKRPSLGVEVTEELRGLYRDEIVSLEHLIEKDLSSWLDRDI